MKTFISKLLEPFFKQDAMDRSNVSKSEMSKNNVTEQPNFKVSETNKMGNVFKARVYTGARLEGSEKLNLEAPKEVYYYMDKSSYNFKSIEEHSKFDYALEEKLQAARIKRVAKDYPDYPPLDPIANEGRFPVDENLVVRDVKLKKTAPKKMSEWCYCREYHIISERIKNIIETYSLPGLQYFSFTLHSHDGQQSYPYFILHPTEEFECIIYELSGYKLSPREDGTFYWSNNRGDEDEYISKDLIQGRPIFREQWARGRWYFCVDLAEELRPLLPKYLKLVKVFAV